MKKYTDTQLSKDVLDEEVDFLHKNLHNTNVKVGEVVIPTGDSSYASFTAGSATAYPVFGELIAKRLPLQELTSFSVFNIANNNKTKQELFALALKDFRAPDGATPEEVEAMKAAIRNRVSFAWDYNEFIAKRKALVIGSINPTSDSFAMFGEIQKGIVPIDYESSEYLSMQRGLSMFEAIKLSREKVILTERNGSIVAVLDARSVANDISGFLDFDLHEYKEMSTEKITSIRFNLSFKTDEGLVFSPINDSYMIDGIIDNIADSSIVSVDVCSNKIPIEVDGILVENGDSVVSNNGSAGVLLEDASGIRKYLPPYGVIKGNGFIRAFTLKDYTVFLGESNNSSDEESLFGLEELSFRDGNFIDASAINIMYRIDGDKVIEDKYTGKSGKAIMGAVAMGLASVEEDAFDTGIDNPNKLGNYIGFEGKVGQIPVYMYEDGENKFIKFPADTAYTLLEFIQQTVVIHDVEFFGYIASFGGMYFIRMADTPTGQVFRNKRFLYDVDYDISEGALSSEPLYGSAYPIDFFRIKRRVDACSGGKDFPFAQYDNVNISKNKYNVGEVSRILTDELGQIGLINTINNMDDIIDTRYKSVFSMTFNQPVVVSSFWTDFYNEGIRKTHSEENWLSVLERSNDDEASRITYTGLNEKENPEYGMVAMSFKDPSTGTELLLVEREYSVDRREHTKATYWMQQQADCEKPIPYAYPKFGRLENPNSYYMSHYQLVNHSIEEEGNKFEFINDRNSFSASSKGDGIYNDLTPSGNEIAFGSKSVKMFFINNQISSVMKERSILSGGAYKKDVFHKDEEMFIYAIPKIGFVMVSGSNLEWFDGSETEIEIRDINKRGVTISDGNVTLSAYLEYDPVAQNLMSKYTLSTKNELEVSVSLEFTDQMPEWFEGSLYETNKNDMFPRRFNTHTLHEDVSALSDLKSIPMILVNYLYSAFGYTQCVVACWDESVNGILVSESISLSSEESLVGSELIIKKEGIAPSFIYDIVPIVNIDNGNNPYLISSDIIVEVKDSALLNTVDWIGGYDAIVEDLILNGDEAGANTAVMSMFAQNFNNNASSSSVTISPVHYTQQDPWKNAKDYTTETDKMVLHSNIKFTIYPHTRINMSVSMGMRNEMTASHDFRLFDENYIAIDGIVSEELLTELPRSRFLECEDTYHLEYRHFYSGLFFLNRTVAVDMSKYPNRKSYMENNLLRELAAPIREDAHHKKMAGRSVVVEWDTRYIAEDIHTYSEIVYELPTALTCDSLPEEALLSREHGNRDSFYKVSGKSISGEDCVSTKGFTDISFSNDSDSDIEVTLDYQNLNGIYGGGTSYFIDKPLFHYTMKKLWPTIGYNGKKNRVKTGIVLNGTTK